MLQRPQTRTGQNFFLNCGFLFEISDYLVNQMEVFAYQMPCSTLVENHCYKEFFLYQQVFKTFLSKDHIYH